jgi:biopolymer transport protein ExbD
MQASSQGEDPITDINVTPLVDVSLVLVIVFMITMPFLLEKGMQVKAESAKVEQAASADSPVLVEISADELRLDGRPVALDELAAELTKTMMSREVYSVAVAPTLSTNHGRVVSVLDAVTAAGAQSLNLVDPQEVADGGK